jgi:hypothetical protein
MRDVKGVIVAVCGGAGGGLLLRRSHLPRCPPAPLPVTPACFCAGRSLHLANTPGAPRLRVLHAVSIVEGG